MNETERRLSRELDRAAAARTVDLDELWEQVQARTARKRRRSLAPYLAAAAVGVVVVVTATLLASGSEGPGPVTTPDVTPQQKTTPGPRPAVIGGWGCLNQRTIEPGTNSVTGKPVRAVLDPSTAPPEAVAYGVPQYQFTFGATSGTLDYADAAGHRIARTELTRTDTGWLVGSRTVCSGPAGRLSPNPVELGRYTESPLPLDPKSAQVQANPPIGEPILVDDRTYYDAAGMLRHRSLYAFATKDGYEFAGMPGDTSYSTGGQKEDTIGGANLSPAVGTDDTYIFGAHDNLGMVLSYLTGKSTVEGLSSRDADTNTAGSSQQFTFPGGRTLYTVVPAPARDGRTYVTVHRSTGDDPPRRF
ncbi:hypothetical protein [Kribbella sindirgiensis]|uniref:Uncharacterized protein n=1 Tax=Kribbella sindirgiensis TaxID=1124744 RepID=A0A4R0IH60_9ACTN|nr:hypothetical protein [Kribbella sindirgiensis]TCC31450.1 hypothetical protein E0H50_22550 [Kribbella sindirgiensis]